MQIQLRYLSKNKNFLMKSKLKTIFIRGDIFENWVWHLLSWSGFFNFMLLGQGFVFPSRDGVENSYKYFWWGRCCPLYYLSQSQSGRMRTHGLLSGFVTPPLLISPVSRRLDPGLVTAIRRKQIRCCFYEIEDVFFKSELQGY